MKKPWQFIEPLPQNSPLFHGPVVRHKGHTFMRHNAYKGRDTLVRVSFRCKVCGLAAMADKCGLVWKNWTGDGTRLTCGEQVAKEVMDS